MYRSTLVLSFLSVLFLTTVVKAAAVVVTTQPSAVASRAEVADVVDLGSDSYRGVEAHALLAPQPFLDDNGDRAQKNKHFQILVSFVESKTGNLLQDGQVAARTYRTGKIPTQTVRLEPQQSDWSGTLVLSTEGESLIKVGCKLADGKKRIYRFFYTQ